MFSFNNAPNQGQQQQSGQQQPQQGQQQPGGLGATSSLFGTNITGTPQPQQQSQQNQFSSPGPLNLNDLGRSNAQAQGGFGSTSFGMASAQANAQQQHPQQLQLGQPQQQQQQPGLWGTATQQGSSFGQPQQQHPQQQPQQQQQQTGMNAFGQSWGPAQGQGGFGYSAQGQQQSPHGLGQRNSVGIGAQGAQTTNYDAALQQQQQQTTNYLPGYLSKIRSGRPSYSSPSRAAEPHSPPGRESESSGVGSFSTPNNRSSRDASGAAAASSPTARFSSSFFSSGAGSSPGKGGSGDHQRTFSSSRGAGGESESIFGPGGLGRRGTGLTASRSSTAMGRSPPGASATSNAMEEDDDAPPVDALQDDETAQFSPSLQSSTGPTFSTSPRPAEAPRNPFAASVAPAESPNASPFRSTMGTGPSVSLTKSIGSTAASEDAAWRTVLVYGFPGSMHGLVLEHFRGMGEIERVAPGDAGGNWLVLIYVQPWAALRALRRSGELVGGATMVGVRWADDALHREAMLNGINALAAPNGAGPSASAPSPAPGTLHTPSAGAGAGALVGTGTGAGGRTGREGTPSFGRPISVVGASGAAYRVKSAAPSAGAAGSPAGRISRAANLFVTTPTGGKDVAANGNRATGAGPSPGLFADKTAGAGAAQQGQGQGQQARAQGGGVMGRLGDAIFGW